MKHYLLILLIFSALLSCDSNIEPEESVKLNSLNNVSKDSTELPEKEKQPNEKLIKISDNLDGFWLSDDYLNNIEKSKKNFENKDYSSTIYGFTLNKENLISNSPYLNGFTDHEGGYGTPLYYNKLKNKFENDLDRIEEYAFFQDPFDINLIDSTQLEMIFINDSKIELYKKVVDDDTELRRILFEGNYFDNLSKKEIIFSRDGQIKGITDKFYYKLLYDFGEGLMFDVVFISLNEQQDNQVIYNYKISNDTLKLFKVNGEIPEYSIGELAYELVKK